MSLVGIRDLSIINTPPEDRLPTRTFICKFDDETIRKAMQSELDRGGQVFFLHNRVQSIAETTAQIRAIVPHARIAFAHGQMDETLLEDTMLKFFNHELDILVCTAIIESGMDIPRANTIFIDSAHTFGVSQLYQLRGRVGRSKERAYCYLLLPAHKKLDSAATERLKIIQENSALGSGLRVAQYDLELRGAGDILGEDQSGHINAVGYDLYMELLEEAINEQSGKVVEDHDIEPEINLRVPALLPDKYIPDIRMRLYYYKTLSHVRSIEDLDRIEDELKDQFGDPPEPVLNLLGLMLIRKYCRDLGVKDVSSGNQTLSLSFTDKTRLPTSEVIRLTTRENKKYSLTPDQRLKIRMNDVKWPRVVEEIEYLISLCPKI
jgi:transcription-repair coupling factor (superfamily II helicase)